jgi:hypothetical protein
LQNTGKRALDVTIQRSSATGTLLDAVAKKVAGRATTEVRLDLSPPGPPEFGWIRVAEKSKAVVVSSTSEYLNGNTIYSAARHAAYFPKSTI